MVKLKKPINEIIEEFSEYTKDPTVFLSIQNDLGNKFKPLLKKVYDLTKQTENASSKDNLTLPKLVIDNFDLEQIWQQIELQNQFISKEISHRLTEYVKNNDIALSDEEIEAHGMSSSDNQSEDSSEGDSDSDDETDDGEKNEDIGENESIVDEGSDISENEDEKEDEDELDAKSDESIDYFQDIPSDDEDGPKKNENNFGPMYNEFFENPDVIAEKEENTDNKKRVTFDLNDEVKENVETKSSFEQRQERLRQRIEKLEAEKLTEKPWYLTGEVTAKKRPQNSLLEQNLEFDLTVRPAPIITEEVALKLEDIIMQRIKDKAWDDVERKIKPVDTPFEFKKKIVLNQEKNKLSLAEIYEQEFLKKKSVADPDKSKEEEEPKEHKLLKAAMDSLFKKLDALSNYHFTPRPAAPEVRIVNNLPAVTMEEAIPSFVSNAALVAPEEILDKKKSDLIGKEERSSTDKKRARRKKKAQQKRKYKEIEKKEKLLKKLKPGMAKKEKLQKEIEKLSKNKSISHFEEQSDAKRNSKSSKHFFEKLQDTISNKDKVKKRKKKEVGVDAKKIKL